MIATKNAPCPAAPAPATRLQAGDPGLPLPCPKPPGADTASHLLEPNILDLQFAVELETFPNRVLLVADDPTVGAIIRERLADAGYDVHWARNRMAAGMLWHPSCYDVVLLELRRDPDRGKDFARRIKATDPAQRIMFLNGRNCTEEAA
jgi:PleD family two-component response regulator